MGSSIRALDVEPAERCRGMEESKTIRVAAGLVFRKGKVLVARRYADAHLGGLWEFPGGKLEPGETFEQCLERELVEELGIVVRVEELMETLTHEYPEKTVHLRFYRCSWLKNEPEALGCAEFAWIRREELEIYPFPAADARLLERLRASPQLWANQD